MRILLTNDDGYDAPGIRALYEAVRCLPGVTAIDVIAPREAQSGKSHAISASFACEQRDVEGLGPVTVVEGTPGDCVRALFALPDHPRPNWVLAGINRGGNLGVDIYYSGTVAAAREATIHGIPAIALSQYVKPEIPDQWARSRDWAKAILEALLFPEAAPPASATAPGKDDTLSAMTRRAMTDLDLPLPPVPCWNVNMPCLPDGEHPCFVKVVRHSTDPLLTDYAADDTGANPVQYRYAGSYQNRPRSPDTDVQVVFDGGISLSPLPL